MQNNPLWLEDCRKAYLEAALFADWPENYSPRTIYDCKRASWEQAARDILLFCENCKAQGLNPRRYEAQAIGYNLWLSRQGHGTGFWDTAGRCPWREVTGDKLHNIAQALGQRYLYSAGKYWAIE